MKTGSVVVLSLISPKQSFFGCLIELSAAGATVRGIDLDAFESWMDTITSQEEGGVAPSTTFFPMYRVERIDLDEGTGGVPSLAQTFAARVGKTVEEHLG